MCSKDLVEGENVCKHCLATLFYEKDVITFDAYLRLRDLTFEQFVLEQGQPRGEL